ncbi:MAG: two-component system response regulator [Proteobacteria bacterium SG_bin7]|nr:MAG: two-component system response regulator [Proteobacteria bacterium SG_bin7]
MSVNILIVDDAPFIRELIEQIVTKEGWTVVGQAENGKQAISMATEKNPDVIVMDLIMPEMSGLDATREILNNNPDAKIIACSTVNDQNLIMRALDAGCVNYITKPFEREKIVKVIKSTFDRLKK